MPKPNDEYGSFGSVPSVQAQGGIGARQNIQASAADFGGQIGQAISNAGEEGQQISNHFAQMATEAKVNDDYANKYVPAAADLRNKFDMLQGQDKVTGYNDYIGGLQKLNKQFTSDQPGLLGQRSMSGLINRHIEGETFGARRELVESQKQFGYQSTFDMLNANNNMAAQNYNNPDLVNSVVEQNDNHILVQHIDAGHDPNNEQSQAYISQAQQDNTGKMAAGMITQAVNQGDTISANALRANYSNSLPGYVKNNIDNTLHTQNILQSSTANMKAISSGQPIPETIGAPASRVQAMVADTAKSSDVEPNNALAVLRIESSNGQNLGTRGTLGQDKGSAGLPIEDQAKALCDNLKTANTQAATALGRVAQPWEGYAVYQQGAGGGVALLKAQQDNPDAKAVDVIAPLYKNPKDALAAITNNGGNATMSVSDFMDHVKQVYDDNAKRADCDFGNAATPGDAILKPHQDTGTAVQPAATPTDALYNFDKKAPDMLAKINALPNYEVRAGVMKAYNQTRQRYQDAASAYSANLTHEAAKLAADPKFTSVDQIPPDMRAALAVDHPQTLDYMEKRAQYNTDKGSGVNTKDMREYGSGFYDLFKRVHADSSDPEKITSLADLQKHVGSDGDITIAGYDKLTKELAGKNTPEGNSDGKAKKQFYDMAQKVINPFGKTGTVDNQQKFNDFYIQAEAAYNDGIKNGKTPAQLLTSSSNDYLGKLIEPYKPTRNTIASDMANNGKNEGQRLLQEIQTFRSMPAELFPQKAQEAREQLANPNLDDNTKQRLTNTLLNLEVIAAQRKLARPRVNNIGQPSAPLAE